MRNAVRSLWAEPRVPDPPTRVWRDWALVAVLVPTAVLEGILRDEVVWRPVALVLALGLVFPLLWRRTHPLAAVAVAFGAVIAVDVARALRCRRTGGAVHQRVRAPVPLFALSVGERS